MKAAVIILVVMLFVLFSIFLWLLVAGADERRKHGNSNEQKECHTFR